MMRFDRPSGPLKTGARPGLYKAPAAPGTPSAPGQPAGTPVPGAAPVFHAQPAAAARHDRSFRRGSLMFIEGDRGEEMFIIKTGRIKILKQEGAKAIELATLGPGSVLGEMSLLIDMPRSATAQVIEDSTAIAIDKRILEDTYSKMPPWLVNVIKVVVSRLRDTLKKNSDNLIRDNTGGVLNLLLLQLSDTAPDADGKITLSLDTLKDDALYAIGISGGDTDRIITELILMDLLVIRKTPEGREVVEVRKPDILNLYFEYLLAHYNGKTLAGETLKKESVEFAALLLSAARAGGVRQKDGTIIVARTVVEVAHDKAGRGRFLDMDALDALVADKVVEILEKSSGTDHLTIKQTSIKVLEKKLERAILLKEWMGAFNHEN